MSLSHKRTTHIRGKMRRQQKKKKKRPLDMNRTAIALQTAASLFACNTNTTCTYGNQIADTTTHTSDCMFSASLPLPHITHPSEGIDPQATYHPPYLLIMSKGQVRQYSNEPRFKSKSRGGGVGEIMHDSPLHSPAPRPLDPLSSA